MAGTSYKDDRRRSAGRLASSLKGGAKSVARAFFGASPTQKKTLRRTKEKKGVKVNELSVNALDRTKFGAPEKIGETVKLIDIAMGNAPAGPAPGLTPPPPPPVPERPTRRPPPPKKRAEPPRRSPSGRVQPPGPAEQVEEDEEDEEEDAGNVGVANGLALFLAVVFLVLVAAGPPLLRAAKPELAVAGAAARGDETDPWGQPWFPRNAEPGATRWSAGPDGKDDARRGDDIAAVAPADADADLVALAGWSRELFAVLGLVFTWLAMSLGRLRASRAGLFSELGRGVLLASFPALLGAAVIFVACDVAPWPAPAALAPLGDALRTHVAPLAVKVGLGPAPAGSAAWAVAAFVLALVARRVLARADDSPSSED